VLALSEQYAVLAATKPKGGGGGLARSWSELCLADSGSEIVIISQRIRTLKPLTRSPMVLNPL